MKPSSLFLNNTGQYEGTRSMHAVKRENVSSKATCHLTPSTLYCPTKRHLVDGHHEVTTPKAKRFKQEWDGTSLCQDKEQLLHSSELSLQNIVSEVAQFFESKTSEEMFSFLENLKFESTDTQSAQDDMTIFEHKETQLQLSPQNARYVNDVQRGHQTVETLSSFKNSVKETPSVLLTAVSDQEAQIEPAIKPIPGKLQSLYSRESEKPSLYSQESDSFAIDYNLFPKLVGVHSISSPTLCLARVESHHYSQQTNSAQEPLEKIGQEQCINDSFFSLKTGNAPINVLNGNHVQNYAADKGHVTPMSQKAKPPTSYTPHKTGKIQESAKSNRVNVDLTSHTERFPQNSQKQDELLFTSTGENGESDVFLMVNDEVFSVRCLDHQGVSYLISAKLPDAADMKTLNNSSRGPPLSHMRSEIVLMRATEQSRYKSYRSVDSQALYVDMHKHLPRDGALNIERRQPSNQANNLTTETPKKKKNPFAAGLPQRVWAGQQRLPPQSCASTNPTHHKVNLAKDSPQNSTAAHLDMNSSLGAAHASVISLSNQQFGLNQNIAARNKRNNAGIDVLYEQKYTNAAAQRTYSKQTRQTDTAVGNLGFQSQLNRETVDQDGPQVAQTLTSRTAVSSEFPCSLNRRPINSEHVSVSKTVVEVDQGCSVNDDVSDSVIDEKFRLEIAGQRLSNDEMTNVARQPYNANKSNETYKVVETKNSHLKQDSQPNTTIIPKHEEKNTLVRAKNTTQIEKSFNNENVEMTNPKPKVDFLPYKPTFLKKEEKGMFVRANDTKKTQPGEDAAMNSLTTRHSGRIKNNTPKNNEKKTNPKGEDIDENSNSARKTEQMRKIHKTREKIAQEKSELNKTYLYRLEAALEKKLAQVTGS